MDRLSYSYDNDYKNRLTAVNESAGTNSFYDFEQNSTYIYNNIGQVTSITGDLNSTGSQSITYNSFGQVLTFKKVVIV